MSLARTCRRWADCGVVTSAEASIGTFHTANTSQRLMIIDGTTAMAAGSGSPPGISCMSPTANRMSSSAMRSDADNSDGLTPGAQQGPDQRQCWRTLLSVHREAMHNALISDLTTRERQRKSGPASNLLLSLILSAVRRALKPTMARSKT